MSFLKDTLKPFVHDLRCLSVIWAITIISTTYCAHVIRPPQAAFPALAPVLETKIFVQSDERPGFEYTAFDVPEAGDAILRVVNAAKVGAEPGDRIQGAEITLNGHLLVKPKEFNKTTDVLKLRVQLLRGTNRLGVKLAAKSGKRLSVRIDAPPDMIRLEPAWDTLPVGGSLDARAMLTGLGRPVRNAQIVFSASGLGDIKQRTASTGATGVARTMLTGFQRAGTGKLTASAVVGGKPVLLKKVPVQVVESPSMVLETMRRARLAPDTKRRVPFFIRLLDAEAKRSEITFEQTVEPDTGGIKLTPSGPVVVTPEASEPTGVMVDGMLEALRLGTYHVIARATNKQTGETASARLEVNVIAPKPADGLVLDPPVFIPAAVTVNKSTPVRFAAVASGLTHYPQALELQAFDQQSDRWIKVPDGDLLDDGQKGDLIAGDHIYARQLTVSGTQEGETRYRVVSSQTEKLTVSSSGVLKITRFPVGAAKGEFAVLEDKEAGRQFVAEQVTARFLPGVPEERIQVIVEDSTRKATGQAGHVIGYLSQIHVVQIALALDSDATDEVRVAAIKATVAELERYDAVRHAQPNFVFKFAQMPQVTPDGEDDHIDPIECSATKQEQWAVYQVKAHEAWPIAGPLSGSKLVAVVDTGVAPGDDLCWGASTTAALSDRVPAGCDPVNVLGDKDSDLSSARHGTTVAGIIAARHHRQADGTGAIGISGIAHGLPVISFDVGDTLFHDASRNAKILAAADTPEVGIINVSVGTQYDSGYEDAVEYATCPSDTVDDEVCECEIPPTDITGRCRLVVAAAGNGNRLLPSSGANQIYPCMTVDSDLDDLDAALCVAATNQSNIREASNYGPQVDISAPGAGVCTTDPTSPSGYISDSGSSLAVPHVSGAAAVLWSKKPDLTAREVANRLKTKAEKWDGPVLNKPSYVNEMGSGLLDMYKAVRYPARLVLVLDKSGSMAWSSRPDESGCGGYVPVPDDSPCGPSRWTVLKQAVTQMLAVADEYDLTDDRFAVAFFDSTVDSDAIPSDTWGFAGFGPAISTFVNDTNRIPEGSTSIGAGVRHFEPQLIGGAENYHQTILLFTDGDQNLAPYLVPGTSNVEIRDSAIGDYDFVQRVSICPIAMLADNPSAASLNNYLQAISDIRCDSLLNGVISMDPSDTDLEQFFLQVLHDALIGDKLELLKVTSGQITRGQGSPGIETFTTSRDDLAFTLLITWPEPGNRLKKVVLSKDSIDFPITGTSNQIHTSSGDTYMAITLRRPFCNADKKCVKSEGIWTLQLLPTFEISNKFTYNLFVTSDNASLASEFRVSQPEPGIGRPLRITASLNEANKPIQGLAPGSVHAFISRPDASLGNVLSKAKVKPLKAPDADSISAAGRKASAMLADQELRPSILKAIRPGAEADLILEESEPGYYEAIYDDTKVSGIYHVRFQVNGHSTGNGKFTRTFSTDRLVEVMADEEATRRTIKVSTITPCQLAGGCYAIDLTPVDAAGNLLGPGKSSMINVVRFAGRILNPISDELDGSYTIRLGYPKPRTENPVIDIQGIRIPIELDKLSTPSSLRI